MSIQQIQEHAGAVGTSTMAVTGIAGFIAEATPILQFALLCVSLIVGVLTAVYYVRKIRKGD